jgi:hypothetical protein
MSMSQQQLSAGQKDVWGNSPESLAAAIKIYTQLINPLDNRFEVAHTWLIYLQRIEKLMVLC